SRRCPPSWPCESVLSWAEMRSLFSQATVQSRKQSGQRKERAIMSAEHFRAMRLPLTKDEFHRLPRNPAYKYELIGGEVWLTPRPRWHHAVLDLQGFTSPPPVD